MQPPSQPPPSQFLVPKEPARPRVHSGASIASTTSDPSASSATSQPPLYISTETPAESSTTGALVADSVVDVEPSQDETTGVIFYKRPIFNPSQMDPTQPTQIMESLDELPDDQARLVLARMHGHGATMDAELGAERDTYVFGTSADCDVIINHAHWPRLTGNMALKREPWFKLSLEPNRGGEGIKVFIEDISTSKVLLNGTPLPKQERRFLQWGDVIKAENIIGKALFQYSYKMANDTDPTGNIVKTEKSKYEVERLPFAGGGYAQVYKAFDTKSTKLYACKVIDRLIRELNAQERDCIAHEVALLPELNHENLLRFHDSCQSGYRTYIFTDYIDGITLSERNTRCPYWSEFEARHIFKQVCEGVKYLHLKNIVHRDIKSENIMVTEGSKRAVLIDFGLARDAKAHPVLTTFCGTNSYMAPETALGQESNGYGAAVDIWALGVVLFKMLTTVYPFDTDSYLEKPDGSVSRQGDKVAGQGDEVTGQGDEVAEQGDEVAGQGDEVAGQGDEVAGQGDKVAGQGDEVAGQGDEVAGQGDEMAEQGDEVVGQEDEVEDKTPELEIAYSAGRGDRFKLNWRSVVDKKVPRGPEVKRLLGQMLIIDSTRRPDIQMVLIDDWVRMMDEELLKYDVVLQQGSTEELSKADSSAKPPPAPWGELVIVPGSTEDAPRRIELTKKTMWLGRDPNEVDIVLGKHLFLSSKQCLIHHKKKDVFVSDASLNGVFVNNLKVNIGKSCQLFTGDILGLIVPPVDRVSLNNTQEPFRRYLKYTVTIFGKSTPTEDELIHRKYRDSKIKESSHSREEKQKSPRTRVAWGILKPFGDLNHKDEELTEMETKIGRDHHCHIIVRLPLVSRCRKLFLFFILGCE
ncbi:kinase-like domain-containing protein [Dissophora ornata]|nr:kinase-like domain-containing protein [Dissophora ornata]